jgi:hypothetical protein
VRARDRELHTLVLTDGPAEDYAVLRILRGPLDEPAAVADALGRNQDALRVQAVNQIPEALPFLADQRRGRHFQVVEKEFRRRVIHHRANRADRQPVTDRLTQVHEQNRQALAALLYLIERRRAADEQQQIGMLGARNPDLLAADDVASPLRTAIVFICVVSEPSSAR